MTQGKTPPEESDAMLRALAEWPEPAKGANGTKSAAEWEDAAEQVSARVAAGAKPRSSMGVSDEELFRAPLPQTKTEEESARDFLTKKEGGKQQRGRDRQSLKELAKMASVTPGPPQVVVEAPAEDSGIVDMGILTSMPSASQAPERKVAAPPPPVVSSRPVAPASAAPSRPKPTLPRELMPVEALEPTKAAPVQAVAAPPPKEAKRRGGGTWALFGGLAVAAASIGVYLGVKGGVGASVATSPGTSASASAPAASSAKASGKLTAAATGAPSAAATTVAIPVTSLAMADTPRAQPPLSGGPAAGGAGKGGAAPASNPPVLPDSKPATPTSSPTAKPTVASNDLNALMQQAVGPATATAAPTPAAANNDTSQAAGSVPLKPSLGAIQGALGAAVPGARGCLGPDDAVSRATVTFKSDGSVQSVAVKGGAVGTPAEGCIRSALMKAHVPPFAQPTFSSPVTIRPN